MEILLKKDVKGVGRAGDVKSVADGFGRNYLIPQGLAIMATPGVAKEAKQIRDAADRRENRERIAAMSLAEKITVLKLTFTARAADTNKLFGSITASDIAQAIEMQIGQEISKRQIELEHPIRELGTHQVPVRLMAGVEPMVTVVVDREGEPEPTEITEAEAEEAMAEAVAEAEAAVEIEAETEVEAE